MNNTITAISNKLKRLFKPVEYTETGYSDERYTDPEYLKELIKTKTIDYCLVDSRDKVDYANGHIESAFNVPYYSIDGNLPSENLFTIIIVYGYTKRSSLKAAELLSELGYFNVVAFGSYSKWTEFMKS